MPKDTPKLRSASRPAAPAGDLTSADHRLQCHAVGDKLFEAGVRPTVAPEACTASVRGIIDMLGKSPDIARRLAERGVTVAFLGGAESLAASLDDALVRAPPDLRRIVVLTPADKKAVGAAAAALSDLRKSALDAARAEANPASARALGVGTKLNKASAASVQGGVQQFLIGAKDDPDLLAAAGIGADDVAELQGHADTLRAIVKTKGERGGERQRLVDEVFVLTLALQRWFQLYRAKTRTALRGDALALASALEPLPRNRKRRSNDEPVAGE